MTARSAVGLGRTAPSAASGNELSTATYVTQQSQQQQQHLCRARSL